MHIATTSSTKWQSVNNALGFIWFQAQFGLPKMRSVQGIFHLRVINIARLDYNTS
jgi:hypothetical protein